MTEDVPHSLPELQRWFQTVISDPQGVAAGIDSEAARAQLGVSRHDLNRVVPASSQLDAVSKLEIYGNAYFARLIECLGDEFPAVKSALGDETFEAFAFSYIQQCPSRSYTLTEFGRSFSPYLQQTKPVEAEDSGWEDFLIDLARLEWHYAEIFNGPGTENIEGLTPETLLTLTPEQLACSRLVPAQCLRLDQFRFPVHEYATAVRQRREAVDLPAATPTWLVMTRRNYVVRRVAVSQAEYCVLLELISRDNEPLGLALERASEAWATDMQQQLHIWFERWAAAGYFTSVEVV